MRKIKSMLLLATCLFTGSNLFAQQTKADGDVINTEISKNFKLKDDILLQNLTDVKLSNVTLYVIDENGQKMTIAKAMNIDPADEERICRTSHNRLKQLRGRQLAIMLHGANGENTSKFKVFLEENHHDLYIKVLSVTD